MSKWHQRNAGKMSYYLRHKACLRLVWVEAEAYNWLFSAITDALPFLISVSSSIIPVKKLPVAIYKC